MRHVRAILYKFILTTAILLFTLGFLYGVSLADILTISALLTLGAYMISDLLLLPNYGHIVATLADCGLVLFGVLLLGSVYIEESIRLGVASFLSALLLAVGEIFFHRYLTREVLFEQEEREYPRSRLNYQTEFAEEEYPAPDDLYPFTNVPPRVNPPVYNKKKDDGDDKEG